MRITICLGTSNGAAASNAPAKGSKSIIYNFIRAKCNLLFKKAQFQPVDKTVNKKLKSTSVAFVWTWISKGPCHCHKMSHGFFFHASITPITFKPRY